MRLILATFEVIPALSPGHAHARLCGRSLSMRRILATLVVTPALAPCPAVCPAPEAPHPESDPGSEAELEMLFTFCRGHTSQGGCGGRGSKNKLRGPVL